jgi:hypothetical protein
MFNTLRKSQTRRIVHRALSSYQVVSHITQQKKFEEGFSVYNTFKQSERPNNFIFNALIALAKRSNAQRSALMLVNDIISFGIEDPRTLVDICYLAVNNSDVTATKTLITKLMRLNMVRIYKSLTKDT